MTRPGLDQLTYTYAQGNTLTAVADGVTGNADAGDFRDATTSGPDYAYYADGSLKQDKNRSISLIEYNLLKLPRRVTFTNGRVVSYQYDAAGTKLNMSVSGGGESRDYVGPYEYLRGSLLAVRHDEGRAVVLGAAYQYEYFCTDHLGNVRVVLRDSAGVARASQYTDFDPWGLVLRGISGGASSNRDQFTGGETISELGSNLVDLGARGYDAQTGRFSVVDAAADLFESLSGYSYGANNPVMNIDPSGDSTVPAAQVDWHNFDTKTNDIGLGEVRVSASRSNQTQQEILPYIQASSAEQESRRIVSESPNLQAIQRRELGAYRLNHPTPYPGSVESNTFFEEMFVGGAVLKPVGALFKGALSLLARPTVKTGVNRIYSARVLLRSAEETGPFHNFPASFDKAIFENGTKTISLNYFNNIRPGLSNTNILYKYPGNINGVKGFFEIGVRLSTSGNTEVIMHRFFNPTR